MPVNRLATRGAFIVLLGACSRTDLGTIVEEEPDASDATVSHDAPPPSDAEQPTDECDAGPDVMLFYDAALPLGPNWEVWKDVDGATTVFWKYAVTCCSGRLCQGFCTDDAGCACAGVPGGCAPERCCLDPYTTGLPTPYCWDCFPR